jgi:phosphoglycerate dehydrogenase-like enzyme
VSRPVVVVLGASTDDPPPGIEAAEAHVELRYAPDHATLEHAIEGAEGCFAWDGGRDRLRDAWPRAGRLRWIQASSDGVDGLLFPELVDSDVQVTNARGVFEDGIAEWVIGAMLAFATGILRQRDAQARREWAYHTRERLAGTRLVVVGPGPIGRAVARRARALGVEVSGVGRAARDGDPELGTIVAVDDLRSAVADADWVLDALPLTDATRHLFDADAFAAMPSRARFINVGRGATVDEPALVTALRAGTIAGAALDVFEEEPLPAASPLWAMPQVLISPHMSGDVEGWERAVVEVFVDNAARFARGEPLRNPVDTAAGFGIG